jgi:hypothetical protein
VAELLVMFVAVTDEITGCGGGGGPELDEGVSAISEPHHGLDDAILPATAVGNPEAGAFVAASKPLEKS